jgi:RNA polymerase sigma-70 factor (ECF subfamily)
MDDKDEDEELIARSRNGDMSAFKVLVERYEGKVAGIIKPMLGNVPQAEDVGQEVFIRFYESLEKFKGESSLGTYLIRIAINLSLNEIKRMKRRDKIFKPLESGHHVPDEGALSDGYEMLHQEIKKLDADFRLVVTLRMIEGYSTEETAKILNIPLGTVLSRLARAQDKLRNVLNKQEKQ